MKPMEVGGADGTRTRNLGIWAYSEVRKGPYIKGLRTPPYSTFPENVRKNVRTESANAYRLVTQGCEHPTTSLHRDTPIPNRVMG